MELDPTFFIASDSILVEAQMVDDAGNYSNLLQFPSIIYSKDTIISINPQD
jgi:hypothetical protein